MSQRTARDLAIGFVGLVVALAIVGWLTSTPPAVPPDAPETDAWFEPDEDDLYRAR